MLPRLSVCHTYRLAWLVVAGRSRPLSALLSGRMANGGLPVKAGAEAGREQEGGQVAAHSSTLKLPIHHASRGFGTLCPLPRAHLCQAAHCPRECKHFFISRKDTARPDRLCIQAQVIHHGALMGRIAVICG